MECDRWNLRILTLLLCLCLVSFACCLYQEGWPSINGPNLRRKMIQFIWIIWRHTFCPFSLLECGAHEHPWRKCYSFSLLFSSLALELLVSFSCQHGSRGTFSMWNIRSMVSLSHFSLSTSTAHHHFAKFGFKGLLLSTCHGSCYYFMCTCRSKRKLLHNTNKAYSLCRSLLPVLYILPFEKTTCRLVLSYFIWKLGVYVRW